MFPPYTPCVSRDELIEQTRRLVAEGDRLQGRGGPAMGGAGGQGDATTRPGVRALPGTEELADRVREAREVAARHLAAQHVPRAPRPEEMER